MASQSQLQTLIELAQRETDEAAKRLGMTIRAAEEAEQKHTMLIGYRDDYAVRFENNQSSGITPMEYRNFQAFLGKLDNAIKGQQEVMRNTQMRIGIARTTWQAAERKRMSYDTLAKRARQEEANLAAKRDQKAMDEHATRQAYYKR
jgi:flagellar FliJ protein